MPTFTPARVGSAHSADSQQAADMTMTLRNMLHLSDGQALQIDGSVKAYEVKNASIAGDSSLSVEQRRFKIQENRIQLANEIRPILDRDQSQRLDAWLKQMGAEVKHKKAFVIPLVSLTYDLYFLDDGLSREIFGNPTSSIQLGISEFDGAPSTQDRLGFSLQTLGVGGSTNKLFVASPQVTLEHRMPIHKELAVYAKVFVGPAYMDYSFDMPNGDHFGAKRLGAEGEFELALRYGRLQLAAKYHWLTEPQDVNFNGLELDLSWIAVRF